MTWGDRGLSSSSLGREDDASSRPRRARRSGRTPGCPLLVDAGSALLGQIDEPDHDSCNLLTLIGTMIINRYSRRKLVIKRPLREYIRHSCSFQRIVCAGTLALR